MLKNLMLLERQSQIKELGTNLNYLILKELIKSPLTCQQLANLFSLSKQKIHYNLGKMQEEGLIEIDGNHQPNLKEVFYRATAKNYVLAYTIGLNIEDNILNNREIINTILENDYKLSLQDIAAKILDESLKVKAREKLLIVTGKYNLPLVEKMLIEAGRRGVSTTMLYQDEQQLRAKYEEYSLALPSMRTMRILTTCLPSTVDVYLNLNGEARFIQLIDPEKSSCVTVISTRAAIASLAKAQSGWR
jgi:DNA-binding transcriptional regulator GbsR (MarR family)